MLISRQLSRSCSLLLLMALTACWKETGLCVSDEICQASGAGWTCGDGGMCRPPADLVTDDRCQSNADCPGRACDTRPGRNRCEPAQCQQHDDCAQGRLCLLDANRRSCGTWNGEERCASLPCSAPLGPGTLDQKPQIRRTRGSNSQLPTCNLEPFSLADLNADGTAELVRLTGNQVSTLTAPGNTPLLAPLALKRPARALLTGDFHGDRYDQVCAVLDNDQLSCFRTSPDRRSLWWWFTQRSFIGSKIDTIVADYDKDGRDDIMLYDPAGGPFQVYSLQGDAFAPMPGFHAGNLEGWDDPGGHHTLRGASRQIIAIDDDGDGARSIYGVLSSGDLALFGRANDMMGLTFWWAITFVGYVQPSQRMEVARLDEGSGEDVAVVDQSSGAVSLLRLAYMPLRLQPVPGVSTGDLTTLERGSCLRFGPLHAIVAGDPGSQWRDDVAVYQPISKRWRRCNATGTPGQYAYACSP